MAGTSSAVPDPEPGTKPPAANCRTFPPRLIPREPPPPPPPNKPPTMPASPLASLMPTNAPISGNRGLTESATFIKADANANAPLAII